MMTKETNAMKSVLDDVSKTNSKTIYNIDLKRCNLNSSFSKEIHGLTFSNIRFVDVHFKNIYFNNCEFIDVVFEKCIFENITFSKCSIKTPHFENTDIYYLWIYESKSNVDLMFKNCETKSLTISETDNRVRIHAESSNFESLDCCYQQLEHSFFMDSLLTNCNFYSSNLQHARFKRSALISCDFELANLHLVGFFKTEIDESCSFTQANTVNIEGFYSVDNIGTFEGKITYCVFNDMVYAGCWKGKFKEFPKKAKERTNIKAFKKFVLVKEFKLCMKLFKLKRKQYLNGSLSVEDC